MLSAQIEVSGASRHAGNAALQLGLVGSVKVQPVKRRLPSADRPRLLADLVTARSPLTASARRYELGWMRKVVAWHDWGVSSAADAGTRPAVRWQPGRAGRRIRCDRLPAASGEALFVHRYLRD